MLGHPQKPCGAVKVQREDPLSMLFYGMTLMPLIRSLKDTSLYTQCFYADDAAACESLNNIELWLQRVLSDGPNFGYFPQPAKSVLIVADSYKNLAEAKFQQYGISVVTGERYLGSFVVAKKDRAVFLEKKVEKWLEKIDAVSNVSASYPHEAFSAFSRSLQAEWNFLTRTLPDVEEALESVDAKITGTFLTSLIGRSPSEDERQLFSLLSRKGGLGIPIIPQSATRNFTTSSEACDHVKSAILQNTNFDWAEHRAHNRKSKALASKKLDELHNDQFHRLKDKCAATDRRRMDRNFENKNSNWLTCKLSVRDNFVLTKREFEDALALRYGFAFKELPSKCDGCDQLFDVNHALTCKKGGLVTQRHNEIRDVVADLSRLAWTSVTREPVIKQAEGNEPGLKADLLIRGVWNPQETASFDIRVTDTDAKSYQSRPVAAVLQSCELEKKQKYGPACSERHITFTPLVCSVDGVLGKEFQFFLKKLSDMLALKFRKSQAVIMGWIRTRLIFAIQRATNLCIRGSRSRPYAIPFEDGAGFCKC